MPNGARLPHAVTPEKASAEPPLTSDRVVTVTLLGVTALGIGVCVLLAAPFASALTWAVALSVVSFPVYDWVARRIQKPNLAASAACFLVGLVLLVPAVFVTRQVTRQASEGFEKLQNLEAMEEAKPRIAAITGWMRANVDWDLEVERLQQSFDGVLVKLVGGTVWTGVNMLITMFLLFYFFRDRRQVLEVVRFLLPISNREAGVVLKKVHGMIHTIFYGTLFVSAVQGTLGGLMFWILGLPGALLWGAIMGLLSIIPILGAFVVWIPAALYLASQGEWTKAIILTIWGTAVVGLIDNWLFPILVGKDTRLHTVPVFISIVGGLTLFGAAGLVLGPVALALTWALIEVLRKRTMEHDGAIDEPA